VITCPKNVQLETKAHKLFEEGYIENMRNTVKNLQSWRKSQALSDHKVFPVYPSKMSLTNTNQFETLQNPQGDCALNRSSRILSTHGSLKGFLPTTLYHYEKNNTLSKLDNKASPTKSLQISDMNKKIAEIINSASPHTKGRRFLKLEVNTSKFMKNKFVNAF